MRVPLHPRPSRRPRARAAAVALTACLGALMLGSSPWAASATPDTSSGESGSAPVRPPVFHEDFERAPDTGGGTSVRDYVGAQDVRFEADDFWADRSACNGFILSPTNTLQDSSDCLGIAGSQARVRALAGVLGLVNGSDPATNSAVAAYTERSGPDDAVELETTTPIPLPGAGKRFVTASVNVAAANCGDAISPLLRFFLRTEDGVEHPVSDAAINPCTDDRASDQVFDGRTARAGHFPADSSLLVAGDSIGVVMRNGHGGGSGNDHAFDDLSVIDVTPTLTVESAPGTVLVGEQARLRFVIENTPELAAKAGWTARTTLPAGLTIAADPRVDTSCSAEVTAPPAGTDIDFSGSLATDEASCTIDVDVTVESRGTHAVDLSSAVVDGLDLGSSSALRAIAPVEILHPTPEAPVESARPAFSGNGEPTAQVTLQDGAGLPVCETTVDESGHWACTSTAVVASGGATVLAEQTVSGTISTDETTYLVSLPSLAVEGSVTVEIRRADGSWAPVDAATVTVTSGDQLRAVATITNTGENPLGDITLSEHPDTRLECSAEIIESGASAVCTSTEPFILTPAALQDGAFTHDLEAVLTGYSRTSEGDSSGSAASAIAGRLPLPDAPTTSTGVIRTTVGILWGVAPLVPLDNQDPQAPLARTGADIPITTALVIGGLLLLGGALVGIGTLERRRGRSWRE